MKKLYNIELDSKTETWYFCEMCIMADSKEKAIEYANNFKPEYAYVSYAYEINYTEEYEGNGNFKHYKEI